MVYKKRPAKNRGETNLGWLDSKHSFSFSQYYDPDNMGFRSIRVINDDIVAPGKGFSTHPHRDMEIISYVVRGALEHKDSMGNGSIIKAGDIQRMTAGTGIMHSEFNPDPDQEVRFLQIWIIPNQKNLQPSYEQVTISEKRNELQLIASGVKKDGLNINQDIEIYSGRVDRNQSVDYLLESKRAGWIQVVSGSIQVDDFVLNDGDGLAIEHKNNIEIIAKENTEFLLFDVN